MPKGLNPAIFRKNDIRGSIGHTLFPEDFYDLGRAIGTLVGQSVKSPTVAVAYDGRLSSPLLNDHLTRGLLDAGSHVLHLGLLPTPALYFAAHHLETTGAVIITGSHNPKDDNGLKVMTGTRVLTENELKSLGTLIEQGQLRSGKGTLEQVDIHKAYLSKLLTGYTHPSPLRVVWDNGNGSAGPLLRDLVPHLPGEHRILYGEVDGTFPHHHPDPTVPENLGDLIRTVQEGQYDLGVAFDGDADRLGVVDAQGKILWGDQLVLLFAEDILRTHPGSKIIGDVKASQTLFDGIKAMGGVPLMCQSGHAFIKAKMRETGAILAGEMSGHLFMADTYYGYDDALYAALRLLDLIGKKGLPLHQMMAQFPSMRSTPELRIPCADHLKIDLVDRVKITLRSQGVSFDETDGLRVKTARGWWLLRYSNTEPALVARCEAVTDEDLTTLQSELMGHLRAQGL